MPKLIDLSGQVFGKLQVIKRIEAKGQARWLCQCDCGNETIVTGYNLRTGLSTSCGCKRKEISSKLNLIHGRTRTKEYMTWVNMRNRCYRPNVRGYDRYGALGIKVCERWLHSFENFFSDMGECPEGSTLDRINPYGNYEPSNCRWADLKTQSRNKKCTKSATIGNVTKPIIEWCEILGLKAKTVRQRINAYGYTPEEALTLKKHARRG